VSQNRIQLHDRVKELTYTQGLGNFALARTADGFSDLERFYNHQDVFFYAVTDGTRYEIGSGVLLRHDFSEADAITYNEVVRHPFRSSNTDDSKIDFPPGVKEVFITYPATHAVMMGSGLPGCNVPQRKGIAVWDSENVLNYFSDITYDSSLKSVGVNQPNHYYGVDVGGDGLSYESRVRASGYFVGATGVYYNSGNGGNASLGLTQSPYQGGTQYVHFSPNVVDSNTNANLVIEVSGDVNEKLLLKKQTAHTVFAGPIDDCNPSCSEDYPLFRNLVVDDLPMNELSTNHFLGQAALIALSGNLNQYTDSGVFIASGYLQSGIDTVSTNLTTQTNSYTSDFRDFELASSGRIDDYLDNASGILYPHTATVEKTLAAMSAGEVRAESFTVSDISTSNNYVVNISPSGNLDDNLLITHAFAAGSNTVSGIFYSPSTFAGQTTNFFIAAHRID
jgi:hypothetical protein